MLDAVFSEWFRLHGSDKRVDVRHGDFVSVCIKGSGIFTGTLEGPLEKPEKPARGPTDDRLFVRLPNGVVLYANLFRRPNIADDLMENYDCYFIEGRNDTFFSGELNSQKPSEPRSVLLTKDIPHHRSTLFMWGGLAQFIGIIPSWAYKNRQ